MALFGLLTVPHWSLIPAVLLVTLGGFFLSIPVAMISTRYRDVGFMINVAFGVLFLLTPVFWSRAHLPPNKQWIVDFNPFAHYLEIIRQAFLGQWAPLLNWYAALGITLGAALLALICLALFRRRVIFWL